MIKDRSKEQLGPRQFQLGHRYPLAKPTKTPPGRQPLAISFYVDAPDRIKGAGLRKLIGHQSLGLEPKTKTRPLIFGRRAGGNPFTQRIGKLTAISTEGPHVWNWKITYPVTRDQYKDAVHKINQEIRKPTPFNIIKTNCAEFDAGVAAAAGIELPRNKNVIGIHDPSVFARELKRVGHGGTINGGVVTKNRLRDISLREGKKKGSTHYYDIYDDYLNRPIGHVHSYTREHLGMQLDPEYRRRGIGTEVNKKFFEKHPEEVFFAYVNDHNRASEGLVRKEPRFEYKGRVGTYVANLPQVKVS